MKASDKSETTSTTDAPVESPVEAPAHKADAIVDSWFAQHFHNLGPKLDVEIHNILHAAKEDLKNLLHTL